MGTPDRRKTNEALAHSILTTEFVNPTASIDNLLFARVKRMACRADFDSKVLTQCRSGSELVAATASNLECSVIRMRVGFHCKSPGLAGSAKKGA
jgi:hypothetical protein